MFYESLRPMACSQGRHERDRGEGLGCDSGQRVGLCTDVTEHTGFPERRSMPRSLFTAQQLKHPCLGTFSAFWLVLRSNEISWLQKHWEIRVLTDGFTGSRPFVWAPPSPRPWGLSLLPALDLD